MIVWFTTLGPSTYMGVPVWLVYLCMCCIVYICILLTTHCPYLSPQLVEVAGCNMWVMEQIYGPSSDPPQMGHPRQKVHAQQYTLSSSERSTVSLQKTGTLLLTTVTCITYVTTELVCVIERDVVQLQYLSGVVRNMFAVGFAPHITLRHHGIRLDLVARGWSAMWVKCWPLVYCDSSHSMQLSKFLTSSGVGSLTIWMPMLLYMNLYIRASLQMVI